MLAFHIGEVDAEYVRVFDLHDNGDDWFSAQVEVIVGGFRGGFCADFNSWAFSDFQVQLEKLYRTVSGSAVFTSYEGQLELTLTCHTTGHIDVQGEAMDYVGTGNKLSFTLGFDQTYLPQILNELQAALAKFPPRAV
jgi:hypothetical protein